ncbi:MAG: PAS domain S-box protein [Verrucomicrobia bacterium]|nr:PAS domain S-box protein [Verrucomicrobiota bacterium]
MALKRTVSRKTTAGRVKGAAAPELKPTTATTERERLLHDRQVRQIESEMRNHELREARQVLEVSRDRYADLYDFAPVGFVTFDDQGVIREINLTAAGMLGEERTRFVGVPFHRHVAREDQALFREHLAKLSSAEERVVTELHLTRKDGSALPVVMQSVLSYDDEQKGYVCRTAITDITARKRVEQALRDSEARLRAVLDTAVDGIITIDERDTIESFNQAAEKLFGYRANEVIGQSLSLLMPSPHREQRDRYLVHYRETGERKVIGVGREVAGRRKDGSVFPLELSVSEVRLGGRRIFTGIVRDITQRKKVEAALSESERRFRHLVESTRIIAWEADFATWRISYVSAWAVEVLGYPLTDWFKDGFWVDHIHPEDREAAMKTCAERASQADDFELEYRMVAADGQTVWFHDIVHVVKGATGPVSIKGFLIDISKRKQAELALRESEERLRLALQASAMGTFEINFANDEEHWNTVEFELLGLKPGEAPASAETFFRFVHPNDIARVRAEWKEALRTGEFDSEFRIVRADGRERWLAGKGRFAFEDVPGENVLEAKGRASRFLGVNFDITERKRAEQRRHLLYETARLLAASNSVAETVPKLIQILAETFEWDVGEFWEAVAAPKKLRMVHVWHAPGRKLEAFVKHSLKLSIPMFGSLPGHVLSTREPEWIPEIARRSHFLRKREAARAGLRSALAFPIQLDQHILGVMAFLTHRVTDPDEDLLQMFVTLGRQIGQFMERKKAEEALREANEFGKQVIDGAETGIVVYDREGRFVVWNPFMERLSGCRAEEVRGRRTLELFPFLRQQHFEEMFARALAGEVFESPAAPFDVPEKGKQGWKVERFAPLRDAREQIVGVIVTVRDITERRRLESELLEASDREQQRIGHDLHDGLGQQLTGLEMKCFLLQEDLAANDLTANRERLLEQARQMSQALRECITVTRSLARGLSPVNLKTEGLMGALKQLAHTTHVPGRVECRFDCRTPVLLDSSQTAAHLFRIAQEAVNNALKHARTRRIDINLAHDHDGLRLQIKDDGRGLPKRRRSKSGMGLEVMRHRAHVIGAALEIESKPGQGVSVTCTLPLNHHEH